ncbi:dihydrolipoyl dehydrogenase family protein [Palaeococcus pacificus]|uniref:dihydrolipoyl dehydrogenase family protein n=1 Tax=Palaeococcus pacificus TaxID=971279 RepID=UPI00064E476C|nr:NAD(P)/FAD-dependent oxidoreductase [Palaeococcus pacificus]
MVRYFDLVVIGSGVAGTLAAHKAKQAGLNVAVVDERPFGGTCALRGCDPKKILVGAAELVDWARRMKGNGIDGEIKIDWKELMKFKRKFTEEMSKRIEQGFEKAGIETFHAHARFLDERTLEVDGEKLEARFFLIATGARPRTLNILGEEYVITSDQFLELDNLPEEIIFVGGGYISFELAHIASRAGAKVKILHRSERPLKNFEPYLVEKLLEATREKGIEVILNTPVVGVEKKGNRFIVNTAQNEAQFEADLVVHGAGRVPNIDGLGLENANIEHDSRGIIVNEYMQSISNPRVYAAGDVAKGGLPLTPVAAVEASIATSNIIKGNNRKINYKGIPTAVFTIPPMASVGLREEDAKRDSLNFTVKQGDTSRWYTSKRINLKHSAFKILIEKETGKILGAHLLGHNADEVINIFALAIQLGLTAQDLKHRYYSYPTSSYDILYML